MGLMALYDADPKIRMIVGQILCLPMIPNYRIIEAFERIRAHALPSYPILKRYFKYVNKNQIACLAF